MPSTILFYHFVTGYAVTDVTALKMAISDLHNDKPAGLLRRMMAACYDWLLVIALMMLVSYPFVAPSGEAVAAGNRIYQLVLFAVAAGFFIGFWTYGGQTPGMRAWQLRLTGHAGEKVSFGKAIRRFACAAISLAPAALGFWWQWLDRDGLSWHDRWSDTRIRRIAPDTKPTN